MVVKEKRRDCAVVDQCSVWWCWKSVVQRWYMWVSEKSDRAVLDGVAYDS